MNDKGIEVEKWDRICGDTWRNTSIDGRTGIPFEMVWVYECGWRVKGHHPYRCFFEFAQNEVIQPVGLLDFYKETGVLPQVKT